MRGKITRLKPVFVENVPARLTEGCLYVSIKYRTVTHLCACGCGSEINTPLHPTGWSLTFDGETVSLWPSVGNWSEKCQSHYVIDKGEVQWSRQWTQKEILEGRLQRDEEIQRYFDHEKVVDAKDGAGGEARRSFWSRIRAWFGRRDASGS